MGQTRPFRIYVYCLWLAAAASARVAQAISVAGDVTYTSDYIFRGISQTDGRGAGQFDLNVMTRDGTFIGAFASSLGEINGRGWDAELDTYLGHRFELSPSWSTTVTAVNYAYFGGNAWSSDNYQELSVAVSYLDRWTLAAAASPNSVRYYMGYRLGRYCAYDADASTQLPLIGRFFATTGLGYYTLAGPQGSGYAYGNAGFAFEYKTLRLDAGYYATQKHEQQMFPYGHATNRLAATLSWHF